MASKRFLSISNNEQDRSTAESKRKNNDFCRVCGDNACIMNYGVLSCSSCKTFFRRHGFHSDNLPKCEFNGNCEITKETRKSCTSCRFNKCLSVGMNRNLIRRDPCDKSMTSKQLVASTSVLPVRTPTTLNLLNGDQSSLTRSEWTLISNVIHAFDAFSPLSEVRRVNEMLVTGRICHREAEKHFFTLVHKSYQSSVSATPDFRVMTTNEQCSLIQRNMNGLRTLYFLYAAHHSELFAGVSESHPMGIFCGIENVRRIISLGQRFDYDLPFVKLIFMIMAFSSNYFPIYEEVYSKTDSFLFGTYRLFGSQNVYVELMWKYMIYRYGYFEAAKRFARLVQLLLASLSLSTDRYNYNQMHNDLAKKTNHQTQQALQNGHADTIPLWGVKPIPKH